MAKKKKLLKSKNRNSILDFAAFEPKTVGRFICYMRDENLDLVPCYILNSVQRPTIKRYRKWFGLGPVSWKWQPFTLRAYDPITPSGSAAFMKCVENPKPFDFTLKLLGPCGDIIEEWEFFGAELLSVDFGSLSWKEKDVPVEITAVIKFKDATLIR